ncbi:MAG TPA: single-stranded-DNA-specific exonuclease RecJ [bacterium]|nr:single-stranded-DNA-specific exonuclease RecJ [bacterium]
MSKIWNVKPRTEESVLRQLLTNRNVAEAQFEYFLDPNWERDTHSPQDFTCMQAAVTRVFEALTTGQKIVIHGDYDADGVCGSTVLFTSLREIAERLSVPFTAEVFLPDREKDGYGVAMHTVERLAAEGVKLLITVDCGIANGLELGKAHELGVDVVVCDHHQMGEHYPDRAIVLHPLAPGEHYINKSLCGTGVAFKLASGLFEEARARGLAFPIGHEKWLLDLVAIATVTDVVPLLGENRTLEYYGLKVLQKTRRPGIKAILNVAGTDLASVDTQTIGFRIGPRLNAAGRLASAKLAFNTLAAQTEDEAGKAALELERLNKERQQIFAASYEEAKKMADALKDESTVLVVHGETWLPGIVGLIAGRLVSDYGLPAFAFANVGEHFVGSGRSLGGLHLVKAMESCGDMFVKRGGHPQACGLTLASLDRVTEFREKVNSFAQKHFGEAGVRDVLDIDIELALSEITWDVYHDIQKCAPFGEGNRPPIFAVKEVRVIGADVMGSSGAHLRLSVVPPEGGLHKMVGFNFGHLAKKIQLGSPVDVAFEVEVNEWNGKKDLQFRIVDLHLT